MLPSRFAAAIKLRCCRHQALLPPLDLAGGAVFAANTELQAAVISGLSGTTGLATSPAIRLSGDFASGWTLVFDDGAGGSGEPDFNDLVILIRATPKP